MADYWEQQMEKQYAMEDKLNESMAINIQYNEEDYEELKELLASTRRDIANMRDRSSTYYYHLRDIEDRTTYKMKTLQEQIERKKQVLMERRLSSLERKIKQTIE